MKFSIFLQCGSATLSGGSQAPYLIGGNDPHFFSSNFLRVSNIKWVSLTTLYYKFAKL